MVIASLSTQIELWHFLEYKIRLHFLQFGFPQVHSFLPFFFPPTPTWTKTLENLGMGYFNSRGKLQNPYKAQKLTLIPISNHKATCLFVYLNYSIWLLNIFLFWLEKRIYSGVLKRDHFEQSQTGKDACLWCQLDRSTGHMSPEMHENIQLYIWEKGVIN